MSITHKLDMAIKLAETGSVEGGYHIGGSVKDTYMSNSEWEAFKAEMSAQAIAELSAGGVDNLSEKGAHPPKMASFGSAVRMVYTLSRNKDGFHFESKLPSTVGGATVINGFCDDGYRYIFVGAKCNEPYSAKAASASKSYAELYEYINEKLFGQIDIRYRPSKCGRYLDVEFFAEGERIERYDLKQTINYLLGIATGVLSGKLERKQIDLIYLLYDPTELQTDESTRAEITSIYERTCYECNLVDHASLFGAILSYLSQTKFENALSDGDIYELLCSFTFTLASQDFYPILLG